MSEREVSCPKCKGGCDLCAGTGHVPSGVARIYVREETRATTRMPARQLDEMRRPWPSEFPTAPATLKRADIIRKVVFWTTLGVLAVFTGVFLVVLVRSCL